MSANSQRCLVTRIPLVAALCPDQPPVIDPVEPFPPGEDDPACVCDTTYDPQIPEVLMPGAWTCFEASGKHRFILSSPHVLHDSTNTDALCVKVAVERVVNCMVECGVDEFAYCWPRCMVRSTGY